MVDSRNVTDIGSIPKDDMMLPIIFEKQASLMREYQKIENMPDWPLNIDTKEHQVWLKDFMWRTTEELCEAMEVQQTNEDLFIEELSDALHFITELTILSGLPSHVVLESMTDEKTLHLNKIWKSIMSVESLSSLNSGQAYMTVIFNLGMAGNCLKNKPWKQTEMLTDKENYYNKISAVWLTFFNLLTKFKVDPAMMYEIYMKKHAVNEFRQGSKY